jgi:L-lactate dehydrogenase (cytochrome)
MRIHAAASIGDYRELARRRLPRILFDYIDGGSYDEVTLARNVEDFAALKLRQRVLRDMSQVETGVELFGQHLSMPVMLGPVGFAGMYARRGEVQAARAAKEAGLPFTLSTLGICAAEEVAKGAGVPPWYQLYMIRDRGYVRELIGRVRALGCPVLVLTVDLPVPGARYRDVRATARGRLGEAIAGLSRPGWLRDVHFGGRPHLFGNIAAACPDARTFGEAWEWIRANFDPSVTWADLDFVRAHWGGPILVKGILDAADARAAADAGVEGIVVSNHGGRQLDGVRSTISALPAIADAVGDRLAVLLDGGVRSGLDVLKALSLGARACLLGRAWAYALAAGGQAGVARMLGTMRDELRAAMVLTGCNSAGSAGRELLDLD